MPTSTARPTDFAPLLQSVAALHAPDHILLLYESSEERRDVLRCFMQAGLASHERVLFCGSLDSLATAELAPGNPDHCRALDSGQLVVQPADSAIPDRLPGLAERARCDGWAGLRVVVDHGLEAAAEDVGPLLVGESMLQAALPSDCMVLCAFGGHSTPPSLVIELLRFHPTVIANALVCPNLYFIPDYVYGHPNVPDSIAAYRLQELIRHTRAIASLRRSERRYHALFDNVADAIFINGIEGPSAPHLEVNRIACERLGYTRKQLLQLSPEDITPPEYLSSLREHMAAVVQNGAATVITAQLCRDGTRIPTEMNSRLIDLNGRPAILKVARDVTERERIEHAMHESERRYRSLFENAPIALFEEDFSQARTFLCHLARTQNDLPAYLASHPEVTEQYASLVLIRDANRAAVELYQAKSRDDLLGDLQNLIDHEGFPALQQEMLAVAEGRTVYTMKIANTSLCGARRHVAISWSVAPEHEATFDHVLVSVIDLTEHKRLEERLIQSQKMEAIGRLAGGVAHDFNNLLTVINGYTDLALTMLDADDPLRQDLQQVRRAGDSAAGLTRQLLAFSRRQMLDMRVLNLNEILSGMAKMLQRLIGEDIELVLDLAESLPAVRADAGQIEQVIVNLAVNARDAMPTGGLLRITTMGVELDDAFVAEHNGARTGHFACIRVSDTGSGIPKYELERIFEPFFTTKPVGEGTGLGLATVFGIVKQSGGNIYADSEMGRGTTFSIYMPEVSADASCTDPVPAAPNPPRGNETILLVEDQSDVRTLTARMLRHLGYRVIEVQRPTGALDVLETHAQEINLLLTDVVMPQISGWDLGKQALERCPDLRLLYMSGYNDKVISAHGLQEESGRLLVKPFRIEELAKAVRHVLDKEPA
ncbi:MAG: PAS domain S-box protein [Anaerolineae bacterium]